MNPPPWPFLSRLPRGFRIAVRVQPKSSRHGVLGVMGDRLKVALHSAPEKGKANRELVEVIAETLDCPARCVSLVAGETSRDKTVQVEASDPAHCDRMLAALHAQLNVAQT